MAKGSFNDAPTETDATTVFDCARCEKPIMFSEVESCWYCLAFLCITCWEEYGDCDHTGEETYDRQIAYAKHCAEVVRKYQAGEIEWKDISSHYEAFSHRPRRIERKEKS